GGPGSPSGTDPPGNLGPEVVFSDTNTTSAPGSNSTTVPPAHDRAPPDDAGTGLALLLLAALLLVFSARGASAVPGVAEDEGDDRWLGADVQDPLPWGPTEEALLSIGLTPHYAAQVLAQLTAEGPSGPGNATEKAVAAQLQTGLAKPSDAKDLRTMRQLGVDFGSPELATVGFAQNLVRKGMARTKKTGVDLPLALFTYQRDVEAAERALVTAGMTPRAGKHLAQQIAGPVAGHAPLKLPETDEDLQVLRDLGIDAAADGGPLTAGATRSVIRKAFKRRRPEQQNVALLTTAAACPDFGTAETALLALGLSAAGASEVARQIGGKGEEADRFEFPTAGADRRILEKEGVLESTSASGPGALSAAAVQASLQKAAKKKKAPKPLKALAATTPETWTPGAVETALRAAGLSPAGARTLAGEIAGNVTGPGLVKPPATDADLRAMQALGVTFQSGRESALSVATVRQMLGKVPSRSKKRQLHQGPPVAAVATAPGPDFGATEEA
ncbi:unnamed protein product, partial [Amoebophrya sp. A120]